MVRIAMVGCGAMAQEHLKRLSVMKEVKVTALMDVDPARAAEAAAIAGGDCYSDFDTLCDQAKPDAVYFATPPHIRGRMEEAAAERGMHLFLESPVALDRTTALRIQGAVRKTGVVVSVGYCYRYCNAVDFARTRLKGRAVSLVQGCFVGNMPDRDWWRRREQGGGQMVNQMTHLIDLVRYLCGQVSEVYGMAARGCMSRVDGFDVDDSNVLTLRLKTGASVCLTSSCIAKHPPRIQLDVVTPECTVTITPFLVRIEEEHQVLEVRSSIDKYAEESRAFLDAIRTGRKVGIRSTLADAVKTLQVGWAVDESIRTGIPVPL